MKILIIDDNAPVARSISRLLRTHETVIITDPAEALARLSAGCFDLVLCDLWMPGQTGDRLLAAIRAKLGIHAPMLVLMSGSDEPVSPDADATLRKPFGAAELNAVVASLLPTGKPSQPPARLALVP